MKKDLADFLSMDLQFLKGVGPVLASRFDELLGGRRVLDFLLSIPRAVKNRPPIDSIIDGKVGEVITVPLEIVSVKKGGAPSRFSRRKSATQINCRDRLGAVLVLQFFGNKFLDYWLNKLPVGSWRMVSGKLEASSGKFIINHPDFIESVEDAGKIPAFQAIYSLSNGLTQKIMANVRDQIFAKLQGDSGIIGALKKAHYPQSNDDLAPENENIQKLAFAELLASQVAIAFSRKHRKENHLIRSQPEKLFDYSDKLRKSLPFALTGAQEAALADIKSDMNKPAPMMRLVQGDVGSGKTIVALFAMLLTVDKGFQAVLLAPTDALAKQHYDKMAPELERLGLYCVILTGRDKGADRHEKLVSLKSGRAKIVIGTHSLFSEDVVYKNLALAVIDEQHRFGVAQRAAIVNKGEFVDVLALSATPIPRTLSMTIYGDMDVSIINERPAGRLPITTTILPVSRELVLIERMKTQLKDGAKAFWVCPLVAESETSDMMNVETRFEKLSKHFKTQLVHGQMDKKSRDKAMDEFAFGNAQVLVATSVIEVGIDIPAATIIVIENAERFGLSALHQIRGRVGRSDRQSYCILLCGFGLSENGQRRLEVLCNTNDGFLIAEQDLMMRGTGEILGTEQSGWMNYHFVDFRGHQALFRMAVDSAKELAVAGEIPEETQDLMWIFGETQNMHLING